MGDEKDLKNLVLGRWIHKTMMMIDDQTQQKHKCHLITTERASYEKYLGGQ